MRGKTSQADITIKIIRPTWSREMNMKAWSKGDDYSMILVTSPAKEKGTVFLKRIKEVWNWIPSIERNIKLPPSMMSQSWMGTDFTNDDLVKESRMADDYTFEITFSGEMQGQEIVEVTCYPKPDAAVVWGKVLVKALRKEYLPLTIKYYDEDLLLAR